MRKVNNQQFSNAIWLPPADNIGDPITRQVCKLCTSVRCPRGQEGVHTCSSFRLLLQAWTEGCRTQREAAEWRTNTTTTRM